MSAPSGPSKPSRPLGAPKSSTKSTPSAQPGGTTAAQIPRRHAGAVPGIARAASNLRQAAPSTSSSGNTSSSSGSSTGTHSNSNAGNSLASIPAHLRNLSTPRIPSPLGKGTPARNLKQSFPVRTSKTTERHVFLPEDPQLAPLPISPMGSQVNLLPPPTSRIQHRDRDHERSGGNKREQPLPAPSDERSEAEKMTKREREEARLPRLTAYTTAEGYRLKLLQAFLKREHGVGVVRVFDDCLYAVYNLPLLPGYGASTKIRSSPAVKSPGGVSLLERMTQAEDLGYDDSYFPQIDDGERDPHISMDDPSEYILSHSPPDQMSRLAEMVNGEENENHREDREDGEDREDMERREDRLEDIQDGLDSGALSSHGVDVPQANGNDSNNRRNRVRIAEETTEIQLGTHLSPDRPGYLSHIPSTALSPDDLPSHPPHHTADQLEAQLEQILESPSTTPPTLNRSVSHPPAISYHDPTAMAPRYPLTHTRSQPSLRTKRRKSHSTTNQIAEAVFYSYGVSVFFGFQEDEERAVMEDIDAAGGWIRGMAEDDWEVEEFHYVYDSEAEYPRIYNDMFTFKSHSHLFKLSLSHAIAQSTKLSIYESTMQESLALTSSFPKELSITGHLQLKRREALKMTGRLFKLRMDVNLIGGILDTPELFWSEASLFPLYEAIREYLEIGPRVQVLNDRLAVAGDLLEIIHEYIEERATNRINWIIIWLIIVACMVEAGEVVARVAFHSLPREEGEFLLVKGTRAVWGATMGIGS